MKTEGIYHYQSPVGLVLFQTCEDGLKRLVINGDSVPDDSSGEGLWMGGSSMGGSWRGDSQSDPVAGLTINWLDVYFSGKIPDFLPPLFLEGSPFQKLVWRFLMEIPYGKTVTYGELARETARFMGKRCMSAQAIGGAVGKNPVSLIVPCHRVIGKNGNLTGYAHGIEVKKALLTLEKALL